MSQRTLGLLLLVAGLVLVVLSVLADVIGVGRNPGAFGMYQMLGALAGTGGALAGMHLIRVEATRRTGWILVGAGLVAALVSVTADLTGVGLFPGRFGTNQILGTIAGVVVLVIGWRLTRISEA